jgi:hypothetical protein
VSSARRKRDFNHGFDVRIRDGAGADSPCDEYRQACVDKNRCQVSVDGAGVMNEGI